MENSQAIWYRIVAPHFTAGIAFKGERCTNSAPILHYATQMTKDKFLQYCKNKGWSVEELESNKKSWHP